MNYDKIKAIDIDGNNSIEKDEYQLKLLEDISQNPDIPDSMKLKINSLLKNTRIIANEPYTSIRRKRRIRNTVLTQASALLGLAEHPLGLPFELMIEPTNICNLRCPLCPTGNGTSLRKRGNMNLKQFKNIIDQLEDEIRKVIFWGFGEPFIHKQAVDMIKYASDKKMLVLTSTNGTTLNNKTLAREIVNSGLWTLYIALDGLTQETLSKYRVGADINDIQSGVQLLKNERQNRGLTTPELILQFVVTRENEHELELAETFFKESSFDKWSVKHANVMATTDDPMFDDMAERYIPRTGKNSRFQRRADGKLRIKGDVQNKCSKLFEQTMINWDGTVIPCCWDPQSEHIFGNALEDGFTKVWYSENFTKFRKKVYSNRQQIRICRDCPTDRTKSKLTRQFTKRLEI